MVTPDLGREASQCVIGSTPGAILLAHRFASTFLTITHCTLSGINHDLSFDTVLIGLFRQLFLLLEQALIVTVRCRIDLSLAPDNQQWPDRGPPNPCPSMQSDYPNFRRRTKAL